MENLYKSLKLFHFKDKIDSFSQSAWEILPSIHIIIKLLTNVYNHSCWYCAYKADKLQLGKDMVIRDSILKGKIIKVIDDIEKMEVKSVTFSNRRIFCYPFCLIV